MRLSAVLLLALFISACANQSKFEDQYAKEYEIISYFGIIETSYSIFQKMAEASPTPEMKEYMLGSAKYFNATEYIEMLAMQLKSKFSEQELNEIINFIRSPPGKDVQSVFKSLSEPTLARALYSFLSTENKAAADSFFNSPTGSKYVAFISSAEFKNINRSYGESLGCRYLADHRKLELARVKSMGKCMD